MHVFLRKKYAIFFLLCFANTTVGIVQLFMTQAQMIPVSISHKITNGRILNNSMTTVKTLKQAYYLKKSHSSHAY